MTDRHSEIGDDETLFAYELEAVYDMELKLVDALGEFSRLATNDNLRKGFAIHRTETQRQVENVEAAFEALGREPERRTNPIVDGLLAERDAFDDRVTDEELRNEYYLTVAMMTERVEITSYEGVLAAAERAGIGDDVTDPLERNLEQEEKTVRKLEGLADDPGFDSLWQRLTDS